MEGIKTYTLYAGVNGAGKSTLYWADKPSSASVRLNSDEIVRELGGDWQDVSVQLEASKLLLQRQQKAFKEGLSVNRETTLCGSNIFKSIEKAKALGYDVELTYVKREEWL